MFRSKCRFRKCALISPSVGSYCKALGLYEGWGISYEFQTIWKQAVMCQSTYYIAVCLKGLRESAKIMSENSWWAGRDPNSSPPKWEGLECHHCANRSVTCYRFRLRVNVDNAAGRNWLPGCTAVKRKLTDFSHEDGGDTFLRNTVPLRTAIRYNPEDKPQISVAG
jgi:hypothetical protein